MGVQFLPYRQQYLVAHLRHNIHPQLDHHHKQQIQRQRREQKSVQSMNVSDRNMFVDRRFHNQRIQQADHHAVTHDQKYKHDLPPVDEQIGKQSFQCLCFASFHTFFVVFIGIDRHSLRLLSLQNIPVLGIICLIV